MTDKKSFGLITSSSRLSIIIYLNSVVAKIFSEISFSPLHVKGNNGFFDGHRTSPPVSFAPPLTLPLGEGVKKSIWFFVTSFRRKPESSVFKTLRTCWTPVFTGVTAEI
jgi:hypothetical protein